MNESVLKFIRPLLAIALTAAAGGAHAVPNWVGTADYTAAPSSVGDEESVGPFSVYDLGAGAVLLKAISPVGPVTTYDGYFQSFVTRHELAGGLVPAPKLDSTYELTAVADFKQTVTAISPSVSNIAVTSGSFKLYFDTTKDRSFASDSGFMDGDAIMTGTITSGIGAANSLGGMIFGVTDITIAVDSYDTTVFDPDSIGAAGGIFTLRLGVPFDDPFLGTISSVQGVSKTGNLLFAADGNIALAVPEAETYAMLLAGLGLIGLRIRSRNGHARRIYA